MTQTTSTPGHPATVGRGRPLRPGHPGGLVPLVRPPPGGSPGLADARHERVRADPLRRHPDRAAPHGHLPAGRQRGHARPGHVVADAQRSTPRRAGPGSATWPSTRPCTAATARSSTRSSRWPGAERRRELIERHRQRAARRRSSTGASASSCRTSPSRCPVRVITTMMGFELEDIPQLKVWSEAWVLPFRGGLTEEEEIYAGEKGVEFQHHIHDDDRAQARAPRRLGDLVPGQRGPLRRRAPAHGRRDHQHGRPPLHRRQRDHDVRAHVGPVAPPHPPRDPGRAARRPLEGEELRRGGPAARVADDGHGALLRRGQRAGRRPPAEGLEPAPALRGRQPRPADLRGPRRSSTSTGPTPAATWPSRSARRTAPAPGCPASSRTSRSAPSSTGCPTCALTPGRNDFTHHPNVTLRAMKELWVNWDPPTTIPEA